MCGIAGLAFPRGGRVVDPALIGAISRALAHRGPDDAGWLACQAGKISTGSEFPPSVTAEAVLLHRRLSIVDLSTAGHQPMGSPDGRFWITFNGEIYNYVELRRELASLGHAFRTNTDTEVLLAAFSAWGGECVNRLKGMFAFGILDARENKLMLARDFFGIKPLYHASWREGWAFASEIKPLLLLPGVSRRADPQRTADYLRFGQTDHGDGTMFADVRQVPPACWIEIDLKRPEPGQARRYWRLEARAPADPGVAESAGRLRGLFLDSVRLHLRSDVPVGAALSGGIDSSAILCAMRYLEPGLDIHAFSYLADEPAVNEERWIDIAGGAAKAVVHKTRPVPDEIAGDLESLIRIQEEPFGSMSIYAQRRVFRLASEAGIRVMLDGQGADELFAGYRYYVAARAASLIRQGRWAELARYAGPAAGFPGLGWTGLFGNTAGYLLAGKAQDLARLLIGRQIFPRWLNMDWFRERGAAPRDTNYTAAREVLKDSLLASVTSTSLPHLLRYEDRNSMAFSIESRVPFLTTDLAEFAFSLPENRLVAPDGGTKAVLREALKGIVPDRILNRRDKIGFAVPDANWMRRLSPWTGSILDGETARTIPQLRIAECRDRWRRFAKTGRGFDLAMWRWINFIEWVRIFGVETA